jgi:hypothetical protein
MQDETTKLVEIHGGLIPEPGGTSSVDPEETTPWEQVTPRRIDNADWLRFQGYEAVDGLDSRLDTLADWKELSAEATVYYLDRERRPRGILLWNLFGKVEAGRELIRAGTPVTHAALVG